MPNTNRAQLDERRNVGSGGAGSALISNNARSHRAFCQGNQRETSKDPSSPGSMGRHQRQPTPTTKNIPYCSYSTQVQGFQIDLRPLLPLLAEKVAKMLATCCPGSQMSAHLAKIPLSWQHNFDPDTFFVSGFADIHQIFLYSTRGTYGEFLCKIWSKYLFNIRLPWTFLLLSTPKFKIFAVTRALPS